MNVSSPPERVNGFDRPDSHPLIHPGWKLAGDKWKDIVSFVSYFPGRGTVRETAYLEGKAEGRIEGKVENRVSLILRVLELHGVPVSEGTRERITSCTDLDTLARWFDRSLTATAAEELFAGDPEVPAAGPEEA
ncbi:hypothetical protein ABT301_14100 [Streptomyces sp. NPDC000987]|uniref:hypothetical protein n=1 Tax=Streptomyces sp. NPDC000987 TaxID=3154374 RepID=UPI0033313E32